MSSTGYSPIGLALRDLGQGFGGILSDEAKRRQDALLAQQQQGQLSLAQAQLRNQAEVAAAQGQVSLAEVGAQGRYRDQQHAIEQDRTTIARDTLGEARLTREQNYGLAERKLNQVDIPTATSTIGYQNKLGDAAVTNARAAVTTATANAERDRAYVKSIDAQTAIHEQQRQANGQMVNLSQLNRELEASDPERAKRGKTWMALMTPYGESDLHYTDKATGDVHAAMAIVGPRLEAYKAMEANLGKTVSDTEVRQKIAATYKDMSDTDKVGLPYETYERRAMAMHKNPGLMLQGTQHTDTVTMPALRQHEIAVLTKELRRAPNAEEIKARIDPILNRRRNEEMDEYAYRAMGVAPPAATNPAPAGSPARAALEQKAAQYATKAGLRPAEVQGTIDVENNGWDPGLANQQFGEEGGVGLGQHTKGSWATYGRAGVDRKDGDANAEATAKHLADLKQHYDGDMLRTYAAYHAGRGKIPKAGVIPQEVTQQSSKGAFTQYPAAFAQKVAAAAARREGGAGVPQPAAAPGGVPRATDGPTPTRPVPYGISLPPIQTTRGNPGTEGPSTTWAVSRGAGVVMPPPSLAAAAQPPPAATPTVPSPVTPQASAPAVSSAQGPAERPFTSLSYAAQHRIQSLLTAQYGGGASTLNGAYQVQDNGRVIEVVMGNGRPQSVTFGSPGSAPSLPDGPSTTLGPQISQPQGVSSVGLAYAAQPSLAMAAPSPAVIGPPPTVPIPATPVGQQGDVLQIAPPAAVPSSGPPSPNAVQASTLSPWFQKTILFAVVDQLGGQNPPPDGVYKVQLSGKNIAAHIQGGQLIAVSPTS